MEHWVLWWLLLLLLLLLSLCGHIRVILRASPHLVGDPIGNVRKKVANLAPRGLWIALIGGSRFVGHDVAAQSLE